MGIAAPQVGISRQLVAVQRLDKTGEPFEFYVNPEIVYFLKILF
ncbi:MAG: peptide deformylase [Butyricimonas virosa]